MKLRQNWERIWQQMDEALDKSGRSREEITLIAVSKTRTPEEMKAIYDFGQLDFGENKPQEIRDKVSVLPADIRWHMIGHLQSNKIKYIVGNCSLIHSVDTLKLAEQINQFAESKDCPVNILLQLDIAQDGKKTRFS